MWVPGYRSRSSPQRLLKQVIQQERVETEESISLAFLLLLEQLQPFERAVFLLREVFEYDFAEIATHARQE